MCKAPKAPQPKDPIKPEFLRNPYLDAAIGQSAVVNALRSGRSSLRIRPGSATPSQNVTPTDPLVAPVGIRPGVPGGPGVPGVPGNGRQIRGRRQR